MNYTNNFKESDSATGVAVGKARFVRRAVVLQDYPSAMLSFLSWDLKTRHRMLHACIQLERYNGNVKKKKNTCCYTIMYHTMH